MKLQTYIISEFSKIIGAATDNITFKNLTVKNGGYQKLVKSFEWVYSNGSGWHVWVSRKELIIQWNLPIAGTTGTSK